MPNEAKPAPTLFVVLLGLFHILAGALIAYAVIAVWPDSTAKIHKSFKVLWWTVRMNPDQQIVCFVLLVGAAGSLVHAATSFIGYAGNRTLAVSWGWWYLLRPLIGGILAVGVYLVVRGGLITVDSGTENFNFYGIAAIGFLSGLFSKQAIDKLNEVFSTLFRTETPDDRKNKMDKKEESGK